MGSSTSQRTLARQAKVRLFATDDEATPFVLSWHWMAWDREDGTVTNVGHGTIEGGNDAIAKRLCQVVEDLRHHLLAELDPFTTP